MRQAVPELNSPSWWQDRVMRDLNQPGSDPEWKPQFIVFLSSLSGQVSNPANVPRFQEKGDQCSTAGNLDMAGLCYTMALQHTLPSDVTIMSTLYGLRAVTLVRRGDEVSALADAQRAVALNPTNANALSVVETLTQRGVTIPEDVVLPDHQLQHVTSTRDGRVVLKEEGDNVTVPLTGTVLMVEKALVSVAYPNHRSQICDGCLRPSVSLIPHPRRHSGMYCKEKCVEAASTYLADTGVFADFAPPEVLLALQLQSLGLDDEIVKSLPLGPSIAEDMAWMEMAKTIGVKMEPVYLRIARRCARPVRCGDSDVGMSLYRIVSNIGHSCDPNAVLVSANAPAASCDVVVVRAVKPIQSGEALTIAYPGVSFRVNHSTKARQDLLRTRFGITDPCGCDKCLMPNAERQVKDADEQQQYVLAADLYQKGRKLMKSTVPGDLQTAEQSLQHSLERVLTLMPQGVDHRSTPAMMSVLHKTHEALAECSVKLNKRKEAFEHLKKTIEILEVMYGKYDLGLAQMCAKAYALCPPEDVENKKVFEEKFANIHKVLHGITIQLKV